MTNKPIDVRQIFREVRDEVNIWQPSREKVAYQTDASLSNIANYGLAVVDLVQPIRDIDQVIAEAGQKIGLDLTEHAAIGSFSSVTLAFGKPDDPYGKKFQIRSVARGLGEKRTVEYYSRIQNVGLGLGETVSERHEFPAQPDDLQAVVRKFCSFVLDESYLVPTRQNRTPIEGSTQHLTS